ncbi:MAG: Rrf2 family transcriptional regulator [Acetobacter sp.]|uniref:RrF2 family transcriptional regulator n=1 Tax=Acetobacter sp. TaxID=440 RepID=UPI0039EA0073
MKLTLQTDYALRALIYLGTRRDRLSTIREIADAYQISEAHMIKVIHKLGQSGFVETIRGRNGGIRLEEPPENILIGDVVRYMEGNMALLSCMDTAAAPSTICALMPGCRLRGVMYEASQAMTHVLDRYTLADVITPFEVERLHGKRNVN